MLKPEETNYDLPLFLQSITRYTGDPGSVQVTSVVNTRRMLIQWIDLNQIEEYPHEYEELIDWEEYKGRAKCWIYHHGMCTMVLASFDDLKPYWEYYLKNVRIVGNYQIPQGLRSSRK